MNEYFYEVKEYGPLLAEIITASEACRREGILTLEDKFDDMLVDLFLDQELYLAYKLICDGTEPAAVKQVLKNRFIGSSSKMQLRWEIWKTLLIFLSDGNLHNFKPSTYADLFPILPEIERQQLQNCITPLIQYASKRRGKIDLSDLSKQPFYRTSHSLMKSSIKIAVEYRSTHSEILKSLVDQQYRHYMHQLTSCHKIILYGSLAIQAGHNPNMIKHLVTSLVGHEYLPKQFHPKKKAEIISKYAKFVKKGAKTNLSSEEVHRRLYIIEQNSNWLKDLK